MDKSPYNLPNLLSSIRIAAVPVLIWLAWMHEEQIFLWGLFFTLLTDAADGFIARHYHLESDLGTRLDSFGDLAIYATMPFCIAWLWPEIIHQEWPWVAAIIASFALPVLVALIKFRALTSYHTWGDKAAAVVLSGGFFVLLVTDIPHLFYAGVVILVLSSIEEIAITLHLPDRKMNIPSLWHLLHSEKMNSKPTHED